MTSKCMVDIETLGTDPGCVVLSLGAVQFDEYSLGEEFYRVIDMESCQEYGLTIDASTLDWWLGQDAEAQAVFDADGVSLDAALGDFAEFYDGCEEVWANAPTFDCAHLKEAYEAVEQDLPWGFRDERCFRTLKALPGAITEPEDWNGTAHDALDDAKWQADVARLNLAER